MTATIEIASGAREVEEALLEAVAELAAEAREDPLLLASPVRIVVPSRSLRLHVSKRLVEHPPNWAAIGALAKALLEHKTIGYRKARKIIRAAIEDFDWPSVV